MSDEIQNKISEIEKALGELKKLLKSAKYESSKTKPLAGDNPQK